MVENGETAEDRAEDPLIVMYGPRSWRVRPGETFTFGRSKKCTVVLDAADRGLSRTAGSLRHHDGTWWVHNDSHACLQNAKLLRANSGGSKLGALSDPPTSHDRTSKDVTE